jgi:hypothetical protein
MVKEKWRNTEPYPGACAILLAIQFSLRMVLDGEKQTGFSHGDRQGYIRRFWTAKMAAVSRNVGFLTFFRGKRPYSLGVRRPGFEKDKPQFFVRKKSLNHERRIWLGLIVVFTAIGSVCIRDER